MFEDFFIRALAGGTVIALAAGPLGCFVVWRRMAYFGDTMAHSALLGVALGFLMGLDPSYGVLLVTVSVVLLGLERFGQMSNDTLLGILSHTALALGLVTVATMTWLRLDLFGYLFGDILAVGLADIAFILGAGLVSLGVLALIWNPLLLVTIDADMAAAEGLSAGRLRLVYTLLLAVFIAVAMKLVGILLITALLIIPAATARRLARSPEQMACMAALAGALSVLLGLLGSFEADTPTGPTIVAAAAFLFVVALLPWGRLLRFRSFSAQTETKQT